MKLVSLPHDLVPSDEDNIYLVSLKTYMAWSRADRLRVNTLASLAVSMAAIMLVDIFALKGVWLITAAVVSGLATMAFVYFGFKADRAANAAHVLHSLLNRMAADMDDR